MDQWGPWGQSPSGSRADDHWQYEEQHYDPYGVDAAANVAASESGAYQEDDEAFATGDVFGAHELAPGQLMNAKVPPAFNGRGSWFAYEELVLDWLDS